MKAQPIKPSEVVCAKTSSMPDEVLRAFNELIAREWDGDSAVVEQDDVVALIRERMTEVTFDWTWLNVEAIYRDAGWTVEYDKPGYFETYRPTFTFTKS